MIKVDILKKNEEKDYSDFINDCSNALVHSTLEWRDVIKNICDDEPLFFIAKRDDKIIGALPAYFYKCDLGNMMLSIPHAGPSGGIVIKDGEDKTQIFELLIKKMEEAAKENNCLLMTIITPHLSDDMGYYKKAFKYDFVLENFYQFFDLREKLRYDKRVRWSIQKAMRSNLKIVEDGDEECLRQFYRLYKQEMIEFNSDYEPFVFFKNIQKLMNDKAKCFYVLLGDKLISGIILTYNNKIINYHLSATDKKFGALQPNTLLLDHALKWAKQKGFHFWNWMSSASRDDGTYKFKKGWGADDGTHYFLTKIIGDISEFKKIDLDTIKKRYKWHYVMPYKEFEK